MPGLKSSRHATAKTAASRSSPVSSRPPNRTVPAGTLVPRTYRSFAEAMALKPSPTLLYRAPPHTAFFIGSYVFGFFCMSYAGWNFYMHYLYPPEGLATWVPVAFGGVCLFMVCVGTYLILAPTRLVRTMTAVPVTTTSPRSLLIRVEVRRMLALPFLKPRVIDAKPADVSLSTALYEQPTVNTVRPTEKLRLEQEKRQYERRRIFSAPFRHLFALIRRLTRTSVRVWTRGGFVKLHINGKKGRFKLDRDGGWALDEGRGIERLIRVRAS